MKPLVAAYAEGYQRIAAAVEGLSDELLSFRPAPGSWSIREIVVHLTDAEIVGIHRMKKVLSERNPLLTAFDQDAWANSLAYAEQDWRQHLALFKLLRESFLPVLNSLTDEQFARTGVHNEAGKLTLENLLQNYVNHVNDHLKQIERVKDAYRKQKK